MLRERARSSVFAFGSLLALSVGSWGCSGVECSNIGGTFVCGPPAAKTLTSIQVPTGAILATSRTVQVNVQVAPSQLPASGIAPLVLETMSGRVLYEGPLRADKPLKARVALPTSQDRVVARLFAGGETLRVEGQVTAGAASVSF